MYAQDWYWPLRKGTTKNLKKVKMHKENIIRNLDMVDGHMQYKQPSEFGETHREESRPYKTNYESGLAELQLHIKTQF